MCGAANKLFEENIWPFWLCTQIFMTEYQQSSNHMDHQKDDDDADCPYIIRKWGFPCQ